MSQIVNTTNICRFSKTRLAFIKNILQFPNKIILRNSLCKRIHTINNIDIHNIRAKTLNYIESMRINDGIYGRYRYSNSQIEPVLYASAYAALTRHLYRDIESISNKERSDWISLIKSYQADDGLFKDPMIDNEMASSCDWWGWKHMTLHIIMALTALDAKPDKKFKFLEPFRKEEYAIKWLEGRAWMTNPANVSNEVQNNVTLLQYARDFQDVKWAGNTVESMLNWLDQTQDIETGLWGNSFKNPYDLSCGVQTGYHLWLLYFYDRRDIKYCNKIIDNVMKTQNSLGGFGVPLNSSACEDIDSIDPLARIYFKSNYNNININMSLERSLPWILSNMNEDGGFVFRRRESFKYGHQRMYSKADESAMFPTWFRSLSLSYLSKIPSNSKVLDFDWNFLSCPGHQFWSE